MLSFKNFVNCFIDVNIKKLPNVFLRSISEITIVTNTFLKHAGCPRGEEGDQIWTTTNKGGRGVKKFNILLDILCEWPTKDTGTFTSSPFTTYSHIYFERLPSS